MKDTTTARERMVEGQLRAGGIRDEQVLQAFRDVPREDFLRPELAEFAYRATPLPIGVGQTISQPWIVALTAAALELRSEDRVLEVGTGSGYAAAILSRLAKDVYSIERIPALADEAADRLARLGYDNVHVTAGDGTLGWPEHAPYDAIAVAASGPGVPQALVDQLAPGGRLVIPVGEDETTQVLLRITRTPSGGLRTETIADVRFVPLIGAQGWREEERASLPRRPPLSPPPPSPPPLSRPPRASRTAALATLVREAAEPLDRVDDADVSALVERIANARVVLLGEATHGTSEFYRLRARITRELVARRGFDFVAVEADWPDAARIDEYVVGAAPRSELRFTPFDRFPTWMWRNEEVSSFVEWLRAFDADQLDPSRRVGFYGLDLYSLFTSIAAVLAYLDQVDPDAARVARARYGTLTPWQKDPVAYGRAVLVGGYASAERAVVAMLSEMLERRLEYARLDGERFFDAAMNARVVANAERYYRSMYYGAAAGWNLRDQHMFETLEALLRFHGEGSKAIVWAHNSHLGDARATDMHRRGEHNVGQLCRERFGDALYAVGFGTDHGIVAAASDWDGPMEHKRVRPAHAQSYERVCHDSGVPAFLLHLRDPRRRAVRDELSAPRLERAIGVVYRPDTELASHYFEATLPEQFDEWVWVDETSAVTPLREATAASLQPGAHPFA